MKKLQVSHLPRRSIPFLAAVLLIANTAGAADHETIHLSGSGATFAAPLYATWLRDYAKAHPGVHAEYNENGSLGGIEDLKAGRVQFATTGFRLPPEQSEKIGDGLVQVPMTTSGIVLIHSLNGVGDLKLSRDALIGIFDGSIARWSDPRIAKDNPDATLPDADVVLVTRAGASASTHVLLQYLSQYDQDFAEVYSGTVDNGLHPDWPDAIKRRGKLVEARHDHGIAATVKAVPGAIGYVAYPYAAMAQLPMALVENGAGKMIKPNLESFAAATNALGPRTHVIEDGSTSEHSVSDLVSTIEDPPDDAAYPILAVSWLLLPRNAADAATRNAIADLVAYAQSSGKETARRFGYLPLPAVNEELIRKQLDLPRPQAAN